MVILHLEMSKLFRDAVKDICKELELLYHGVSSVQEARQYLTQTTPDLVLTASELKDASAMDLLTELQTSDQSHIRAVVITSGDSLELRQTLFSLGIVDYIRKSDLTLNHIRRYLVDLSQEDQWIGYLRNLSIAILDDSKTGQMVIQDIFAKYQVEQIDCYNHPFQLLGQSKSYDLYLIDLVLPGLSGEEVILNIREKHPSSIIIAVSAITNPKTISYVLLSGADDYLPKPFDRQVFMARIRASVRTFQLVKELEEKKQALQYMADTDGLTGLYNHRYMFHALEQMLESVPEISEQVSVLLTGQIWVLLMDIDYFKKVNDTFGHPIGDQVLVEFAQRLKHLNPGPWICGRYGGEEFMIILPYDACRAMKVEKGDPDPLEIGEYEIPSCAISFA
jgi:two-component system cell cycle response regulator